MTNKKNPGPGRNKEFFMRRPRCFLILLLFAFVCLTASCGKGKEPTLPLLPGGIPASAEFTDTASEPRTVSPDASRSAADPSASESVPVPSTAVPTFPVPESDTSRAVPSSSAEPSRETPYVPPSGETTPPDPSETTPADPSVPGTAGSEPATESPEEISLRERAAALLNQMDLRTRLFQLIIVTPESISPDSPVTAPDNNLLGTCPAAGILYQAENMESPEQLTALTEGHQKASAIPLFICVNEEGGRAACLIRTVGTTPVKNMYTYRGDGIEKARTNALTLAADMRRFGFNLDLAPVADVWSDPENKGIGERAFSDDFGKAASLIAAAVRGFHDGGVICTLKHFPGAGEASEASSESAAAVTKTLTELRREEFLPFAAGIEAGADIVMTGRLLVPDLDPVNPAPFSRRIVTDLLRDELGFDGVVMTDVLETAADAAGLTAGEACLKALNAGCDLLLCPAGSPEQLSECVDALLAAAQGGRLSAVRIDESVLRILMLKLKYGILE